MSNQASSVVPAVASATEAGDTLMEVDGQQEEVFLTPESTKTKELGINAISIDLNVSASEESKGGIKYEVLIGEAKAITPKVPPSSTGIRPVSADVIQLRIDAAAERRQSLETERLAALAEKHRRLEEAAKKREEEELKFTIATKENLEQKIETSAAKRETLISDLKTKLSTHNTNHLQEVRQNAVSNTNAEKAKQEIEMKLETAEKNREKVLNEKLENLKKHDEKVEMIRTKRTSVSVVPEDMIVEAEKVVDPQPQ